MKKNLMKFAAVAFAALGLSLASHAGDIFDIVPLSGSCTPDNALKSGQKFQFILRLLARDYEADQPGEWGIVHVGIGSEELDKLYPPKIGIVVSGQMRYAEIISHGPNPEKGSLYTDLYCEYKVEPGDFALPVKLALASSTAVQPRIPLIDTEDASEGYFLQNVAGIDPVSPKWQFQSIDVTAGVPTTNVCAFTWCTEEVKQAVKGRWPSGRMPATDIDLSKASFYVKSIDFDSDNPAYPGETPYWRTVHEGTTETVPRATIETIGLSSTNSAPVDSTTFYVWSENEDVAFMDGANVTEREVHLPPDGSVVAKRKVYKFDLVTGVPKYPISFRGKTRGESTTIVLSATPDYTYNYAKTAQVTNYLYRTVFVDEPPKPNIKVTWDAAGTQTLYPETGAMSAFTNDLSEVGEQGVPLYITLSEPFGQETTLHLKAKIADDESDDWSFVYTNTLLGVLSKERSSFTVPPVETNITFSATEKQLAFYIYPVGGTAKTKNPGVKLSVEFDKATPEEIRKKYENEGASYLKFLDPKPAIVTPSESDSYAFAGGSCTIPVVVMDCYRDLSEPRTFAVQAIANGIILCTSNAVPFRSGESTPIVLDSAVLQKIQGPEAKEMKLQVKVTDPLNQSAASAAVTLSVPAKEKTPTVTASLYASTEEGSEITGRVFDEGVGPIVRFTLDPEPQEVGNDLYAFLVPRNWASSNLVKYAAFETGILIAGGQIRSALTPNSQLTLLDGTEQTDGGLGLLEFDIVMKKKDGSLDRTYTPAESPALQIAVKNVPTAYDDGSLYVNGAPEPTPNGGFYETTIASGVDQSFVASYRDVSHVDLTNGIVTVWCFTDGRSSNSYKYSVVTSTTDTVECKHGFTTVNADQKVMWIPVDKDTLKSLTGGTPLTAASLKTLWPSLVKVTPAYTITVHVGDAPHIVLGQEEMTFPENTKDARVQVSLSEPCADGPVYLKLTLAPFDEAGDNKGHVTFPGNVETYVLKVAQDAVEPVKTLDYNKGLKFDYDHLDGTLSSAENGFSLTVEAYEDEKCEIPLTKYANAQGYVYVNNCPPTISPKEPETQTTNKTLTVNEEFSISWRASDVPNDVTNDTGLVCNWYIDDNVQGDKKEVVKTNLTSDLVTKLRFTSEGYHKVTLVVLDKEGEDVDGKAERNWHYYIAPTKGLEVRALGPAPMTKTKYGTAAGLGLGRVWANGIKGTAAAFAQTWTYNIKEAAAEVHAYGYASGAPYRDDGDLGGSTGQDLAIDGSGNSFPGTVDKDKCYLIDGAYDNYFYRWAFIGGDGEGAASSSEVSYGAVQPMTSPTVDVWESVALDPYEENKESYTKRRVEAVFSREYLASDNLGDINQDGIPDILVSKYGFGVISEGGEVTGDDIKLITSENGGNSDEDFLPAVETSVYSGALIPELKGTWADYGTPFLAKYEIRGYHEALNDALASQTVDGKLNRARIPNANPDRVYEDPDLSPTSTLSKVEWLAYVDAGCPGTDKWSPERPSDPTLYDTDDDGLPDGYEYFFWYRAHVGYMEGDRHVYMTGSRFDPENPSMGKTITSEEIARICDPLSAYGDASEAQTRDTDNDGLPDLLELELGTNPFHWDTDGDGLPDGYEVAMNGGVSGSVGGIDKNGEATISFDPCGRHVGVDEAMYNGDHDAMAYEPASEMPERIYGYLQSDGSIRYYWIPGATNVIAEAGTPCWAFTRTTVATNRTTGAEYEITNVYLAAERPVIKQVGEEWVLAQSLTEDKCWLGSDLSTNGDAAVYIRTAPRTLPRGFRVDGEAAEAEYRKVTYGGRRGGAAHRVFLYGPRFYDEKQPYGQWVCGAEVVRPRGIEVVSVVDDFVFLIHTHVYQGIAKGDGAKAPWQPDLGWGGGKPYTQLDEFLVCFWHYLDEQPDDDTGKAMDLDLRRNRTWVNIWSDYCTDPSTADTDGDGIPDGWELYVLGGPKKYNMLTGERERAYGPRTANAAKNPAAKFAGEFHGYTCSLYFGPYCQSIIDSYLVTHPFWTNKKRPTDPWEGDTDGDGIDDTEEEGLFAYLQRTPAWKGKTPSYPDAIPGPGAGGGLDPLSWDTDMDGLPDPWERQYGSDTMGHGETFDYVGEDSGLESTATNCWCRMNDSGKYVPTVDGTVADAGEDYDHDGLLNWQEYLVSAMRCWRYDDTISSWNPSAFDESAYTGGQNKDPAFWTERLINGGVIYPPDSDEPILAGIDDLFEYDGQFDGYNPQIQVDGMWDIGAGWFSLCTNAFDQAKGKWYMFYDGVYHDLRTEQEKWIVPGLQPDICNRFTWRSYTLQYRNPLLFASNGTGQNGWYWFGDSKKGDYLVYPHRYPGTDPNDFDTDDDGMDDYWELFHGLNPLLGQSGAYRVGSRPAVDCVYEAYVHDESGELIKDPESGAVRTFASAEHNYWTWLDKLEEENPHFAVAKRIRQPLPEDAGFANTYDFGRFPWLNGLGYADPDGDNIRNQQEAIFPQVQANSTYLHTDPSPLWMTDKYDAMSLTHRYYQLPDVVGFTDESWADAYNDHFTDTFGNPHKWTDFPGFEWDEIEGLTLPDYSFNEWSVPNPSKTKAESLATVKIADFAWDFEENEGYDSDKDYLSDFEEEQGRTKNASNPQDADDPLRRQAMWFGGEENKSVLQTPMEVDREPPTDNVPSGVDQPFLFFTVECWAKPESNLKDPKLEQVLVERSIWSGSAGPADDKLLRKNFQIGIRGSAAGALWYVKYDSSGTDAGKSVEITDGPEVMSNGWTHVAATYDGENLKLYVNGVCLRTLASKVQPEHGMAAIATDYDGTFREGSLPYPNNHRAITVGASIAKPDMLLNGLTYPFANWYDGFYNQYYKGYIDEVRIWDGARTATEILDSYRKRFTAADALENRTTVFNAWNVGYTREAVTQGILPAELKYHWNFDHVPGATRPDWVMAQPTGFSTPEDTVDGKAIWTRPADWVEPWWGAVNLKSTVYTDPAWMPWIVDTVHHLPNYDLTTLDSFYWSEDYVGDLSVLDWAANYFGTGAENPVSYSKFTFPRTHELPSRWTQVRFREGPPFTISDRYRMICRLIASGDPNGPVLMKRYAFTLRHALCDGYDLLPLGGAYPKRISAAEGGMWDENGAADAWAQSGKVEGEDMVDPEDQGVPNWWTKYYLQNHPELDPDTVIRWDTVLDYNGVPMPAWQAYIRDLAEGLLPDGEIHPEYRDERDMNRNGLPDWWEDFWKLTNRDADADPDNDGLSTYAEYLAVEGDYPYGVTNGFPQLNPTLTYSTTLKVTDYFLSGPTNNLDAKGRHIFANEYLGEIFTDHDFMEDWWERLYARTYADPVKYDPLNDRDEDGWSNFAECRAALWGGFFSADLIDSWTGSRSDQHVVNHPEPTIGVKVTYHGDRDISGQQLVIRTISGQSKRVDATFVIPASLESQMRYIGPFQGDSMMRGQLSPGLLNVNSVVFERAKNDMNKTFFWNWNWYEERQIIYPEVYSGTFEDYRYYYARWPHIELEGGDLVWEAFAIAVETMPGTADLMFVNGNRIGTLNSVTGEYEIDFNKFDQNASQYVFRATYTSRVGHEWPQTVYVSDTKELAAGAGNEVAGNGRVKEGRNTIEAFMDLDGDGKLGEGEPFGVVRNVQVGWHKVPEVLIELKDKSPIMPVVAVGTAGGEGSGGSGQAGEGQEGEEASAQGGAKTEVGLTKKIAVYRDKINGVTVPDRLLATTTVVLDDHPYITEADVSKSTQPDLDWTWLLKDVERYGMGIVSSARYHVDEIVTLSDGTVSNIILTTFGKQFSDVRPTAVAVAPIDSEPIYTAAPTFSFSVSDETATGYRLQVREAGGTLVYDSGVTALPGRTGSTVGTPVYAVTPSVYADDRVYCAGLTNRLVFADGSNYEWRVTLYNAKFKEPADDASAAWSIWAKFKMDLANKDRYPDQPTGYGVIPLAVRYFGPLTNVFTAASAFGSNVVVEAYENADFRGQALARLRLSDVSALRDRADVGAANALLRGIRPGTVYLRAFIDQNGNGSRDNWESWGYVNMVGKGMKAIYNPESFEVIGSAANWELAAKGRAERVIYIEDCDLNRNEIPDCLEPEKFPATAENSEGPVDDPLTWWEWAEADPEDAADGDVMAFREIQMRLVTIVSNGIYRTCLQPVTNAVPVAGNSAEGEELYSYYMYGDATYGLGTNVTASLAGWKIHSGDRVHPSLNEVPVLLVHKQVYDWFGFNIDTAVPWGETDTRPFTAQDKYWVLRYLESTGSLPADAVNPHPEKYATFADYVMNSGDTLLYEKWTLKPGELDMDHDGIADGWELYVGGNPLSFADREDEKDGDGLKFWEEYNRGGRPTDPNNKYSMYEALEGYGLLLPGTAKFTDDVAHRFPFPAAEKDEDGDIDLISNIQEMMAYYRDPTELADLSVSNAWSNGTTPDYFRVCGSKYLGELFNGAEFIEPSIRRVMGLGALIRSGTCDYDMSGWDAWSTARFSILNAEQSLNIEGVVSDELMLLIRYWNVIRPGEFTGTTVGDAMDFFHEVWAGVIRLIDDEGNVVIEGKKPAGVSGWGTIHDADAAQTTTQVVAFFGGQAKMEEVIAKNKKDLTADEIVTPEPTVNLVLKYAGNESYDVVLEAYQVNSAYPEYGEQLTAQWAVPTKFDAGVAKVNEIRAPSLGSLKQGPARFVAYIDKDGDGRLSPDDTYGTADVNVGYLDADVTIRLGEANPALPVVELTDDGSNAVNTVAFVRTKVNGLYLKNSRGVLLRRYDNNVSRTVLYPADYLGANPDTGKDYIGIDPYLASGASELDPSDGELPAVEEVTYEIVKLRRSAVSDEDKISNTNLNHYVYNEDILDPETGEVISNIVHTVDQQVNEEFTVRYSLTRDVAMEVKGEAASLENDTVLSFTIPTDRAVTKFWLEIGGKEGAMTPCYGPEDRGFLLPNLVPGAQENTGRVILDRAWFVENKLTDKLTADTHRVRVALGNDKFPEVPTSDDEWSATATFSVAEAASFDGVIDVMVLHPTADLESKISIAVYEKADLANPVVVTNGCAEGATVEIGGLRPGAEYYVAAWYVKYEKDGRDSANQRMPYDTWGYLTMLGESASGFDAKSVKAVDPANRMIDVPMVTNLVFLQDTDWNDNNVIDREEDIRSILGRINPKAPEWDPIDVDGDGIVDPDDPDPVFDNSGDWIEGDVMAYQVKRMLCVQIGTVGIETNWTWYAVMDPKAEPYRLSGDTVIIPRGTAATNLTTLCSTYLYGRKKTSPYGLGTNVTLTAGEVYHYDWMDVVLVHNQVYKENGFNPNTANALISQSDWVNSKKFTALDKYIVTNYLAAVGAIAPDAVMTNWVLRASDKKHRYNIDFDFDGIPDGWELYTMFGHKPVKLLTKTPVEDVLNAWVYGDRAFDPDGDTLVNVYEYDGGHFPTDPWSIDTDRDGITDNYAWQYHLKGDEAGKDLDGDGLSNYAEYLISEVFRYAKLDPENPKTDGDCVDYFRKMGDLYVGEIFTDHDQVDDTWEAAHANIANRYVYDPNRDDDEDGWSNWAEYCAENWGYGFYPDIIDTFINGDIDSQLRCFPQPVLGLRVSYNGQRDVSWKNLIVKMSTGDRTRPDAVFEIDSMKKASGGGVSKSSAGEDGESSVGGMEKTQVLGVYTGNPILRGYLNPGLIVLSSAKFEMTSVSQELTYKWHCTECERGTGSYEDYKADINEHGEAKTDPNNKGVTLDEVKPSAGWETIAQAAGGEIDGRHGQIFSMTNRVQVGEIDYRTGEYVIDLAALSKAGGYDFTGKAFKSSFAYALGAYWPQTVWLSYPEQGYVKEGKNTIEAFFDLNEDGQYNVGEPYGIVRGVDVSWHGNVAEIELSETSAITPRIDLLTGESDRVASVYEATATMAFTDPLFLAIYGTNDVARAEINAWFSNRVTVVGGIGENQSARVRVVRYGIDDRFCASVGVGSATDGNEQLVMLDKRFDATTRSFLCEADFLGDGEFDIDWNTLSGTDFHTGAVVDEAGQALGKPTTQSTMGSGPRGAGLVVSNMTYLVVLGDGPTYFNGSGDTNTPVCALATMVTRRFEVTRHNPVGENVETIVHNSRPTFRWSIPDEEPWAKAFGSSYTAFRLQILKEDGKTVVYDSGVRRAPAQDKNGFFTWTVDAYVGDQTALGQVFGAAGNWKWRVAMYNAKFKPTAKDTRAWSKAVDFSTSVATQQETDDNGYSSIDVTVKYTGPEAVLADCEDLTKTNGTVRIQAFTTADFSGEPVAQGFVTNRTALADAADILANGRLIGLPSGTYYVRAYIDSNGNFRKDDWESWGQVKGEVEVKLNQLAPIVGLYIEDADTDQDWIPDAYEYLYPDKYEIGRSDASVDPEGGIILKKEIYDGIVDGTANISRFLSGATLTLFENFDAAGLLLGITGETAEATINAIRKAVEKNIDPDSVKITSLTVDAGSGTDGKVILTVGAKATDSVAGYLFSPVYEVTKPTVVYIEVYRKENLATAGWGEPITNPSTGKPYWEVPVESTIEKPIEIPMGGVNFNSGFYKVEIKDKVSE